MCRTQSKNGAGGNERRQVRKKDARSRSSSSQNQEWSQGGSTWGTSLGGLCLSEFLLEALGLVVGTQGVHQRRELAVHDVGKLMQRQADAVIGHAILGEIVRADFFRAVAGFDLAAPLGHDGGLLLFLLHFIEARAKNAHGFGAILNLRFLVLLRNDEPAGDMRDA